jgi:hypothetical protein
LENELMAANWIGMSPASGWAARLASGHAVWDHRRRKGPMMITPRLAPR